MRKTKIDNLDSYYTPIPIADKLVEYITENNIRNVIDFCVGDGVLLKAVKKKFGNLHFFGTDISADVIKKITSDNPDWTLGVCDFRDIKSVKEIDFLEKELFDLIMFNPPFTCKGSLFERIRINDTEFRVSTAMSFIMNALQFLSPTGGMYAILPISCIYSQKDRMAWTYLQSYYNACVLEEPERVLFKNKCSPKVAFVYIGHQVKQGINTNVVSLNKDLNLNVISVVRGCMRMQAPPYSKNKKAVPLIHTTNIQYGIIVNTKRIIPDNQRIIRGYGVVIPRVCNPSPQKIALLDGQEYILSDCIIALLTKTMEDAIIVRNNILENWTSFVTLYKGTGAQYTTLERVRNMFIRQQNEILSN